MEPIASLAAASISLVGGHFVLSHPLRASLVKALSERGFLALYSLLMLAALAWIVLAFLDVGPGATPGSSDLGWIVASLLTIVALVPFTGSLKGNPAAPTMGAEVVSAARPTGVYAVTRHPMMWGFALWAAAHILVMPSPRTLITAGAVAVLALVGAHLQDRKKEALLGQVWRDWEARTGFWPRLTRLGDAGLASWAVAIVLWLVITWVHVWLASVPAGIWRWVG